MTEPISTIKLCRLSPDATPTLDAVWTALARDLDFPAHFGANRDALWDCLTGDLAGPAAIVIENPIGLRGCLGPAFDGILAVLRAAAAERGDLTITLTGG